MNRPSTLIAFFIVLFITACSASTSISHQGGIEISNVNVVLPAAMAGMDMGSDPFVSMRIKNASGVDDRLVGVTSDFAEAMLNETVMNGDVATMKDLTSVDVPAGTTLEFKHGGFHIMFVNPSKELKAGDSIKLTLEFEKAGKITVSASVTNE